VSAAKRSTAAKGRLQVKRVYAPAAAGDGLRVLVDRLWPRGIAKQKARVDLWLKELAPSDALRRGVHGGSISWHAFAADYARELEAEPGRGAVASLREHLRRGPITLLYAARDEGHNNAVALKALLEKKRSPVKS
jgi:uncharacterized protein YeaO (DUF488 family)